jgi:hypothetical protein
MKIRLHYILILSFMASTAITATAFGQDSPLSNEDPDTDPKTEYGKVMYSPGELDTRYTSETNANAEPGDSITNTAVLPSSPAPKIKIEKQPPVPKPTVEKQSKEEDDSILSFNFLYYIIQKYKLQDIVD